MPSVVSTLAGAVLVLGLVFAALPARPAAAQSPRLSTPYPSVAVEAGDRVTLDLEVTADTPEPVSLEVAEVPDGWEASLRGGGFLVGAVFAASEDPPEVELEVSVPADAAEGSYTVVVEATASDGSAELPIELRLEEAVAGDTTLTAEFPSLRGPSDTTFEFDAELDNATPQERTFSLAASAPSGWQVDVRPAGEDAASTVTLEAGETTDLTIEAVPPPGVTAGTYPVAVQATDSDGSVELELEAEVTGTFDIVLTSPDERLDIAANPGEAVGFDLVVVNEGSAELQEVELEASAPTGWDTSFEPEVIAAIPPEDSASVRLVVEPAEDAVIGDYRVTVSASAPEVADEVDVRVSVETSRAWGLVGVGLVAVALGGLGLVFRTFGRR